MAREVCLLDVSAISLNRPIAYLTIVNNVRNGSTGRLAYDRYLAILN